jgi:hypothetical protein
VQQRGGAPVKDKGHLRWDHVRRKMKRTTKRGGAATEYAISVRWRPIHIGRTHECRFHLQRGFFEQGSLEREREKPAETTYKSLLPRAGTHPPCCSPTPPYSILPTTTATCCWSCQ